MIVQFNSSVASLFLSFFVCVRVLTIRPSDLFAGDENLGPLATDLLNFTQVGLGSSDPSPGTVFPLIMAEEKTRRPDVLQNLKLYKGGWNITNVHYWTVSFLD